jgi:hypothetical protein
MRMKTDDIQTYPKFTKYVSASMPALANVSSIIAAIDRISELGDTAKIKTALAWGQGPILEVKIMIEKQVGNHVVSPRAGFTPSTNTIGMRQKDVSAYENGADLRKTQTGHMVHLVGAQLLHELVHWARYQAGKSEDEDLGFVFEREVYGAEISD